MNIAKSAEVSEHGLKRCVIYTRVSGEEQAAKEHNSCEIQAGLCREYIEKNRRDGWLEQEVITDAAYTGSNLDRPGIAHLISLVKHHKVQVVVVYRRDRLFRNVNESTRMQSFFDFHGVSVASVVEGISTRAPHAKFATQMIDAMSELERSVMIGRIRDSVRRRAQEGYWKAGIPTFGYSYTPGSKILRINEAEAEIVRLIFNMIAAGENTADVCRELRLRRMFGRGGKRRGPDGTTIREPCVINTPTIRNIITNVVYKGYIRARNPDAAEGLPRSDPDAYLLFRGKHEILVDEETWFRANRLLKPVKSDLTTPKGREKGVPISFLGGVTRCGDCQCAMSGTSSSRARKDGELHRYLRCSRHTKARELSRCRTKSIAAVAIEQAILELFTHLSQGAQEIQQLSLDPQHRQLNSRIATMRDRLKELDEQILNSRSASRALILHIKTGTASSQLGELLKAAEQEQKVCSDLEADRARVEGYIFRQGAKVPDPAETSEAFRRLSTSIIGLDVSDANKIIHELIDSITISKAVGTSAPRRGIGLRIYKIVARLHTNQVLAFGVSDLTILRRSYQKFSDLEFAFTLEVRSKARYQEITILETATTAISTKFNEVKAANISPEAESKQCALNPVQRAIRWNALCQKEGSSLTTVALNDGVSKATVSTHILLLGLPQNIITFFREGKDSSIDKPFSTRELFRMLEMSGEEQEGYFISRTKGFLQRELHL